MDMMTLEILEDGTVTVKTSAVSASNHMSADELLSQMDKLLGGTRVITPNEDAQRKDHAHAHQHKHAHQH